MSCTAGFDIRPCCVQKLDSVAAFCMPAFNPRMLSDYVELRGALESVPSRELTQALKLRFLQTVHELKLADVAARLPGLLPGQAGLEALGAVSRQASALCRASCCWLLSISQFIRILGELHLSQAGVGKARVLKQPATLCVTEHPPS